MERASNNAMSNPTFRRLTFWQRLRMRFSSRYRAQVERDLRDGIRWLVEHPDAPVYWE